MSDVKYDRITVLVPPEVKRQVQASAQALGVGLSAYIRMVLAGQVAVDSAGPKIKSI